MEEFKKHIASRKEIEERRQLKGKIWDKIFGRMEKEISIEELERKLSEKQLELARYYETSDDIKGGSESRYESELRDEINILDDELQKKKEERG